MIDLDKKGYPIIKLGVSVPTESGNPFHDVFTGQFAFAPPGVNVVVGKNILKEISSSNRKILFNAAKKTSANQLGVSVVEGEIIFNLFRDGKLLTKFALPDDRQGQEGDKAPKTESNPVEGLPAPTGAFRDAIVDAARETSIEGDALKAFFEEKLGEKIDDRTLQRLSELVDEQRINDLSDYLNSYLSDSSATNKVRLSAPRGYVRKAFASLETQVVKEVFRRLKLRGWSDEIINKKIVAGFSKDRRKELGVGGDLLKSPTHKPSKNSKL